MALGCVACVCLVVAHVNNQWIKPLPTRRATSFSVEEVRQGFATVPLVVVVNLFFAMGYNATNTAFPRQACQMNTLIGGAQLNGTQMNLGDAFAIIACSPLFEGVLFPLIRRLKGSPVRLGQKLVAGLLVAALGNAVAARLEVQRRQAPLLCGEAPSRCAPAGVHMRDISAFWMLVPYALIGAAEVLVNPCMFYFCYTAAPPKVRSLVQAFNLFFVGAVPSAFTSVAVAATLPDDLDSSRLEYYYILNVACALAGVLAYFLVTRCGSSGQDLKDGAEEDPGVAQERPADRAAELQEEAAPCRDDA
uniref:Major facilitator superfamily (MFS) profile domain-containing protein n=1 Tax=Zooxanthella nutricula TaxID=1333877 RepID=A0A7S2HPA4_9DINO